MSVRDSAARTKTNNLYQSMSYRFPRHRITEFVAASKCLTDVQTIEPERVGEHGARFHAFLDVVDGGFVDLRFLGKAGGWTPTNDDASPLLDWAACAGWAIARASELPGEAENSGGLAPEHLRSQCPNGPPRVESARTVAGISTNGFQKLHPCDRGFVEH